MMKRILQAAAHFSLFTFLFSPLLVSCQKELCYDHPHTPDSNQHGRLHVAFDWSDTQNPETSEMHLAAFRDGGNPVTYPLAGMAGGNVSLWAGRYWFVAYNGDTETTTASGTTYEDFEIRGVQRTVSGSDLRFIWEPERVWVSTAQDFGVEAGTEQTLPMTMWAATYQYTFLIHNVANLDRVSSITATITGLASSYSPAASCPKDYTVAEVFEFHKVDSASIRGTLRVFGHSPDEDESLPTDSTSAAARANTLTLYVTTDVNNHYAFDYNVSEDMQHPTVGSIDTQTGEIVINIQIDDIPVPDQPPATGGIQPSVDGWQDENIEVTM